MPDWTRREAGYLTELGAMETVHAEVYGRVRTWAERPWAWDDAEAAPLDGGPWLDRPRGNRVLLLDAGRGHGKTTLLLSLLRTWTGKPEPRAIRCTEVVSLDTLDRNANLAVVLAARLEALEGASADESRREARDQRARLDDRRRQLIRSLAHRSSPQVVQGRTSADPEIYPDELADEHRSAIDAERRFRLYVDELIDLLTPGTRRADSRQPAAFLIVPIDDADIQPRLCVELLRTLRILYHERVAYLLTGDTKLMLDALRVKALDDFDGPASGIDGTRPSHLADTWEMAARLLNRSVAPSNRFPCRVWAKDPLGYAPPSQEALVPVESLGALAADLSFSGSPHDALADLLTADCLPDQPRRLFDIHLMVAGLRGVAKRVESEEAKPQERTTSVLNLLTHLVRDAMDDAQLPGATEVRLRTILDDVVDHGLLDLSEVRWTAGARIAHRVAAGHPDAFIVIEAPTAPPVATLTLFGVPCDLPRRLGAALQVLDFACTKLGVGRVGPTPATAWARLVRTSWRMAGATLDVFWPIQWPDSPRAFQRLMAAWVPQRQKGTLGVEQLLALPTTPQRWTLAAPAYGLGFAEARDLLEGVPHGHAPSPRDLTPDIDEAGRTLLEERWAAWRDDDAPHPWLLAFPAERARVRSTAYRSLAGAWGQIGVRVPFPPHNPATLAGYLDTPLRRALVAGLPTAVLESTREVLADDEAFRNVLDGYARAMQAEPPAVADALPLDAGTAHRLAFRLVADTEASANLLARIGWDRATDEGRPGPALVAGDWPGLSGMAVPAMRLTAPFDAELLVAGWNAAVSRVAVADERWRTASFLARYLIEATLRLAARREVWRLDSDDLDLDVRSWELLHHELDRDRTKYAGTRWDDFLAWRERAAAFVRPRFAAKKAPRRPSRKS